MEHCWDNFIPENFPTLAIFSQTSAHLVVRQLDRGSISQDKRSLSAATRELPPWHSKAADRHDVGRLAAAARIEPPSALLFCDLSLRCASNLSFAHRTYHVIRVFIT
jgi:hypothetical protein